MERFERRIDHIMRSELVTAYERALHYRGGHVDATECYCEDCLADRSVDIISRDTFNAVLPMIPYHYQIRATTPAPCQIRATSDARNSNPITRTASK